MERLRNWYLNFRGRGEQSGPDGLLFLFILGLLALGLLGDTGYWWE